MQNEGVNMIPDNYFHLDVTKKRVEEYMRCKYSKRLYDMDITDVPGSWVDKEPCGGAGVCMHPLHGCIGNRDGVKHTYGYMEIFSRDNKGRFISPYASWWVLQIYDQKLRGNNA